MNDFFNTFQKEARSVKLSMSEKQAMRVHVYNVMQSSPALSAAQRGAIEEFNARKPVASTYSWFSARYAVSLAVLLVAGLSGGTTFAAQSALPGQPLYAVKIQVNEKVAVALATTPQAKAEVNARLATTRLEEAETLASQGTLDATTTSALAGNFAAHAEAAQANTVAIAASDPGTAAQLGTTFSSTLAAHGAILAQLASDAGTSSVQVNSDALAIQVLTKATHGRTSDTDQSTNEAMGGPVATTLAITATGEGIAMKAAHVDGEDTSVTDTTDVSGDVTVPAAGTVKVTTFSTVTPQIVSVGVEASSSAAKVSATPAPTVPSQETSNKNSYAKSVPGADQARTNATISNDDGVIALALASQASTTLGQVQASFAAIAPSLDASTSEQITFKITDLQEMLMQGNDMLMAGDSTQAKLSFNHVLRASVTLDAFLKAGKKFNAAFLTSLLK